MWFADAKRDIMIDMASIYGYYCDICDNMDCVHLLQVFVQGYLVLFMNSYDNDYKCCI